MSLPFVKSQTVWDVQDSSDSKELDSDFQFCQFIVVEITTTGFSGTIDIKGKVEEHAAYSNVPYIRQDALALQTPAVAQLSLTTNTAVVRYVTLGYWRRYQIVMTRTAGTITIGVAGSSNSLLFPRVIQT